MDKKYIQENEIDIKYLRGQLADDELELFEIYLMENSEVIEQLELDGILGSVKEKVDQSKVSVNSWFGGLFGRYLTGGLALGIAMVVGVVGLQSQLATGELVGSKYIASTVRSATSDNVRVVKFTFPKSSYSIWKSDTFKLILENDLIDGLASVSVGKVPSNAMPASIPVENIDVDEAGNLILILEVKDYSSGKYKVTLYSKNAAKNYYFEIDQRGS